MKHGREKYRREIREQRNGEISPERPQRNLRIEKSEDSLRELSQLRTIQSHPEPPGKASSASYRVEASFTADELPNSTFRYEIELLS